MRNLHIVLGRRTMSQDIDPVALYVGLNGDAAITARDTALASGEFAAAESVPYYPGVLRYADPEVVAAFKPAVVPSGPVDQSEIERLTLEAGEAKARIAELEEQLVPYLDKPSLIAFAQVRKVEVTDDMTKAEIIDAIQALSLIHISEPTRPCH
jgi:hypothetical protein